MKLQMTGDTIFGEPKLLLDDGTNLFEKLQIQKVVYTAEAGEAPTLQLVLNPRTKDEFLVEVEGNVKVYKQGEFEFMK